MDKNTFLVKFIKFNGWVELFLAVMFFFMEYITEFLGLDKGIPLFYQFAAVELLILGFLLLYSARDIKRYLIIILSSCVFRYIMPAGPELYAILTLWPNPFAIIMIPTFFYDIGTATITLVLLKQLGYLKKENF